MGPTKTASAHNAQLTGQAELLPPAPTVLALQAPKGDPSMMSLLQLAIEKESAIDVIERLTALHERALDRDAEAQFNQAMNAAQNEIKTIIAKSKNEQTGSMFASYDELDEVIRPIYVRHGFSLSFDCGEPSTPKCVRTLCDVAHRGGHTKKYRSPDIPLPTTGPKGNAVMTETHGTGAAMSYGQRYLLIFIFNIPIKKRDTDGNGTLMDENQERDFLLKIREAKSKVELRSAYDEACKAGRELKDAKVLDVFKQAAQKRSQELGA